MRMVMSTIHVCVSMRMVMGESVAVSMTMTMTMTTMWVSMPCQSIITICLLKSSNSLTDLKRILSIDCLWDCYCRVIKQNSKTSKEHYLKTFDWNMKTWQRLNSETELNKIVKLSMNVQKWHKLPWICWEIKGPHPGKLLDPSHIQGNWGPPFRPTLTKQKLRYLFCLAPKCQPLKQ